MEEGERIDVFEFERNETEKVMVSMSKFRGNLLADLRIFFVNEDNEWRPTKKGVSIPADKLSELKEAVNKLVELAGKE